jgi:hypothetical protein
MSLSVRSLMVLLALVLVLGACEKALDSAPNPQAAAPKKVEGPKPEDMIVLEGEIKRSMMMTMPDFQTGSSEISPPMLTLVTADGKEYSLRRILGCTGGPGEPAGGVIQLGSLGRFRCKGVLKGSILEAYTIESIK